ncbi:MAG: vitamin B12-dependent ribonucleotide reductase, partial [Planctomycetes bacterium]|nr:vitamin B12-dependent ribonucleotide reductase [Planctomycetota bacterium]
MSRKTKTPGATKSRRVSKSKREVGGAKAEARASNSKACPTGLAIPRIFTKKGEDVLANVKYARRGTKITNPDGSIVFQMDGAEIPADWSQLATDIMISKYFRKAQVPQYAEGADPIKSEPLKDEDGNVIYGPERSARQVVNRLAGCWRHWGEKYGYFKTAEDAQAYYDEMSFMLINQYAAPNSPQWFNTGLAWAYDLKGPSQGHYYVDPDTAKLTKSKDAYTHPQPHACFIQHVSDDLVGKGGIMDLWTREARLFKYGSGTGTNFSKLRGSGEPLSGGGQSSGLMSFLRVGDRAAGAIKSGGTTRRAAKMVCLDLDHPDIETFINWKAHEEDKAKILIDAGLPADFNGEAYGTVSGQNSNNSVRVPSEFIDSVRGDGDWHLRWRTDRNHISKTVKARDLWNQIAKAAWQCADPGVQYDTVINDWHTCPQDGRINASNPCSEYMFLDDTACNLASLNLIKFFDKEKAEFDVPAIKHATRLWTMTLEISVLMAQFPSEEIAQKSYDYRTLGLGY